jgi:hypothetical protein
VLARQLPPMGVRQWSARLSPAQRDCCGGLAVPQAEAGSVLAAMQAARTVFRREALAIMTAHQAPWPTALEEAVLRYQAAELGW